MLDPGDFVGIMRIIYDCLAAFLFCNVMALFIVPIILERLFFYIPRMIVYTSRGEVSYKGILYTVAEMLLWLAILVGLYVYFYCFQPEMFTLVTLSIPAKVAWVIGLTFVFYRLLSWRKTARGDYYQVSYKKFITPSALKAYQEFLDNLSRMSDDEVEELVSQDLPYLQQQAVLRKHYELIDA